MTMQAQAPTQRVQSPPAFLNAPGEMAELIRTVDWSQTPLGPAESWPQSLRTSLSICLHSHFPILLWWGPELVMLYNDAYRPMLGASKHPAAMGQPGQQCWAEIWHIIGPMLAGVLQDGKASLTVITSTGDGLNASQVAQIRDIVLGKCTGLSAQDITVVEVK